MDIKDTIATMTVETKENLSLAVEIGRWPDGSKLTDTQKADSIQALIAWETYYGEVTDEPFRVQKGGQFNKLAKK